MLANYKPTPKKLNNILILNVIHKEFCSYKVMKKTYMLCSSIKYNPMYNPSINFLFSITISILS